MHPQLKNKTIAFVTSREYAGLAPSDRIAAVVPAVWDDASIDWTKFDAIIIRSPWDYYQHADRFIAWIDLLDRHQLRVWNPTKILRWNMDKRYLLDLQKKKYPDPAYIFF
jgi:hypothetical protein